jgi:hypothetical protein
MEDLDALDWYGVVAFPLLLIWAACSVALARPTAPAPQDSAARRRLRRALRGSVRRE